MRNLTKEKAEVRKVSLGPSQEALVVLCLPGSRNQVCKFWKAGKCQRGNDCAFQHPPKPAAPSTKDDKHGKSQKKKKKNKKKGDRSRSSSRGSNSSRGSQSLRDKGGKPSSPGSAAVCLMRSGVGRSCQPFDQYSSRAGRHRLQPISQPAFCHASYTQSHCFICGQR